jgi:hypothetical protein
MFGFVRAAVLCGPAKAARTAAAGRRPAAIASCLPVRARKANAMSATSTSTLTTVLNAFESLNWAEIGAVIAAKGANIGQDISTAEDLATAIVSTAAIAGVPVASTVAAALPLAKNLIATAESFFNIAPTAPAPAAS